MHPDQLVMNDEWSDLSRIKALPEIDFEKLYAYRMGRLKGCLQKHDAAMCLLVNPISLRYAAEYRTYGLFQSHIPSSYLFVPKNEGPVVMNRAYGTTPGVDKVWLGHAISFFDGGFDLEAAAKRIAQDVLNYLSELGTDNRRVAVEYINPSVIQALEAVGLEVIDGVLISEEARLIKSAEEVACIQWAVDVAELGIAKLKEAIRPGVSETQLWGLLNYTNLANNGDWHDGRMLASGDRINPWLQEASMRRVESGDLVGFDTDMVGPFGYFADVSRTMHCGPAKPTKRQKEIYRLAYDEVQHNMALVKPGVTFVEYQQQAFEVPEEFQQNAYTCVVHAVGMCDEYPRIDPKFRGPTPYDGVIEAGMVLCIESYMGAVGERDGVKLEQQVLVTEDGYELFSHYPFEEELLD